MKPCVYILTNATNSVLYTGVTSDIEQRVMQHREGREYSFTCRYHLSKLVYVEYHPTMDSAIMREKQIKSWARSRKEELINSVNPMWRELMPCEE